jgi:hypothetical protein
MDTSPGHKASTTRNNTSSLTPEIDKIKIVNKMTVQSFTTTTDR